MLEQGNTGWYKIQSVFAWARMWGAPIPLAYALQGIAIVALGAALAWLWRSAAPYPLQAAALCLATILATPYSFDYDMMVLAPAIAFIAVDGFVRGFRSVGEDFTRGALAGAAGRPHDRACEPHSARCAGHARYVRSDIAAQRTVRRHNGFPSRVS